MSEEPYWSDESFSKSTNIGKLAVFFSTIQVKNHYKSQLQGRDVFEEKIILTKMPAADRSLVVVRPKVEADEKEFAAEWHHWVKTRQNKVFGFPIENWPAISDTQKAEFKALKIFTVEQFANLSDSAAKDIMGFNDLRRKAQVFVNAGKDAELIGKIREEANERVKALEEQVAKLMAMLEKQTEPEEVTT